MYLNIFLLLIVPLNVFVLASQQFARTNSDNTREVPARLIYQSQNTTFFENLAVRSNGQILLNTITEGSIYTIDPAVSGPVPRLLTRISGSNGLTGIVELRRDVFLINAATWNTSSLTTENDSAAVWEIDLRGNRTRQRKIASIPGRVSPNGMTTLPGSSDTVLVADSLGRILSVNSRSGKVRVVIQHELLTPLNPSFPLGVNGIRARSGFVYFTNSARKLYGRIPIGNLGEAVDGPQIITRLAGDNPAVAYDDFALDRDNNAWITVHRSNCIQKVTPKGRTTAIVPRDGGVTLKEPTAATFGRGNERQERTLYVVTGGDFGEGVTVPFRGQIAAYEI